MTGVAAHDHRDRQAVGDPAGDRHALGHRRGADIGQAGKGPHHPAGADKQCLATGFLHDPGVRRRRQVEDCQAPVPASQQILQPRRCRWRLFLHDLVPNFRVFRPPENRGSARCKSRHVRMGASGRKCRCLSRGLTAKKPLADSPMPFAWRNQRSALGCARAGSKRASPAHGRRQLASANSELRLHRGCAVLGYGPTEISPPFGIMSARPVSPDFAVAIFQPRAMCTKRLLHAIPPAPSPAARRSARP